MASRGWLVSPSRPPRDPTGTTKEDQGVPETTFPCRRPDQPHHGLCGLEAQNAIKINRGAPPAVQGALLRPSGSERPQIQSKAIVSPWLAESHTGASELVLSPMRLLAARLFYPLDSLGRDYSRRPLGKPTKISRASMSP